MRATLLGKARGLGLKVWVDCGQLRVDWAGCRLGTTDRGRFRAELAQGKEWIIQNISDNSFENGAACYLLDRYEVHLAHDAGYRGVRDEFLLPQLRKALSAMWSLAEAGQLGRIGAGLDQFTALWDRTFEPLLTGAALEEEAMRIFGCGDQEAFR